MTQNQCTSFCHGQNPNKADADADAKADVDTIADAGSDAGIHAHADAHADGRVEPNKNNMQNCYTFGKYHSHPADASEWKIFETKADKEARLLKEARSDSVLLTWYCESHDNNQIECSLC